MLEFTIQGGGSLSLEVKKMINGGLSNRDQAGAQKHLDEILKEGIDLKLTETPVIMPKLSDRVTNGDTVEVLGGSKTCGEAEPVLIIDKNNEIYIASGSDHSDRELEKHDLVVSKQMCANVVSKEVWRYLDVKDHWDDLILRGWVIEADGTRKLYQEGKLGEFMTVEEFLGKVKEHVTGDLTSAVVFMGTFPTLGGKLIYTPGFEAELIDEKLGRTLSCKYTIAPMTWFK